MSIQIARAEQVVEITLNRPDKKNALTVQMYREMTQAIAAAKTDPGVRALLITGSSTTFCAGNDLADFASAAADPMAKGMDAPLGFLRELATLDKPLIAAVAGPAVGIGTTLLLHCDFVYATPTASFKLPFVDLAVVPEAASSLLLAQMIGPRNAARMLQLCETVDATTALAWGLCTALDADPVAAARATAQRLCQKAPSSLQLTKQLCAQAQRDLVLATIAREGEIFAKRLSSPEAMEAFTAFMQRRAPDFSKF